MLVDARSVPPPDRAVADAASALRAGLVVALPTDTVYGIAALPGIPGATGRLFALKGRSADVPLAVLCADAEQALALADLGDGGPGGRGGARRAGIRPEQVAHGPDDVRRVAGRLWPGPLTLVLPRQPGLGYELGEPAGTVGVRCPDHALVRALAAEVGPLATTSANRHGEPTPATAPGVVGVLGDGVAVVLDGGPCPGAPSTVVDVTEPAWRVLRPGELSLADLEAAARP